MKIDNYHFYHGAVVYQILEHNKFKSMETLNIKLSKYRDVFKINNKNILLVKYSSKPKSPYLEYVFNFTKSNIKKLIFLRNNKSNLYLALVCVEDREICCLSFKQLIELIKYRYKAIGNLEKQISILVTLSENKSFNVYVNKPGRKGHIEGNKKTVKRNSFPKIIFGNAG